jgi:hypothetical protein
LHVKSRALSVLRILRVSFASGSFVWTAHGVASVIGDWNGAVSSADGTKLAVPVSAAFDNQQLLRSTGGCVSDSIAYLVCSA